MGENVWRTGRVDRGTAGDLFCFSFVLLEFSRQRRPVVVPVFNAIAERLEAI